MMRDLVSKNADMLIVLEPMRRHKRSESTITSLTEFKDIAVSYHNVGDENILVIYNKKSIASVNGITYTVVPGERDALHLEVKYRVHGGMSILTAHAPYHKNDGSASNYQNKLLQKAKSLDVDVVVGDLNTYGQTRGTKRTRDIDGDNGYEMVKLDPTSAGGSTLDKVFKKRKLNNVSATVIDTFTVDKVGGSSSRPQRKAAEHAAKQQQKYADHKPIVLLDT